MIKSEQAQVITIIAATAQAVIGHDISASILFGAVLISIAINGKG